MTSRRAVWLGVLALTAAACGGTSDTPAGPGNSGGSTGPTLDPTCAPSATPLQCSAVNPIGMQIRVQALNVDNSTASFSYTLGTQVLSGTGTQYAQFIGFSAGVYQISGEMKSQNLSFGLGSAPQNGPGGPVPGSLLNLLGPLSPSQPAPGPCYVQYFRSDNNTPTSFKFQFTITSSKPASFCQFQ